MIIRGFPAETALPPELIFGTAAAPAAAACPRAVRGDPTAAKTSPATPPDGCWRGSWAYHFGLKMGARFGPQTGQFRPRLRPESAPRGAKTRRNGHPGVADHRWGGEGRGGRPFLTVIGGARGERKCLKHRSFGQIKRLGFRAGFRGGARPRGRRPSVWRARRPWGMVGS